MTRIAYRFDYYHLALGQKQGGFALAIPTETLVGLQTMSCTQEEHDRLQAMCTQRLDNLCQAKMLKKAQTKGHRITLWNFTPVPRVFCADPVFGGSLGANPQVFEQLSHPDALTWIGDEVEYTPHNVDSPVAAMIMTVQIATWGEWAQGLVHLQEWKNR